MQYRDLRDFIAQLERQGELKRIGAAVDPKLEMTEICDRVLKAGGPALLFEQPKGHDRFPCSATCSARRSAWRDGHGARTRVAALREIGKLLAFLKEPDPPKGLKDAWQNTRPVFMQVLNMAPKERHSRALPGDRVGGRGRRSRRACRCRRAGRATSGRSSPGG